MVHSMRQGRFWGKARKFKTPAHRQLKIALSERGIYEPVILEKHVVGEIIALLWYNGIPVFQEKERVPQCNSCGASVCAPSEAGHPDLHGWIPARKRPPIVLNDGSVVVAWGCSLYAIPFYIECKRPQGGIESYVQKKFIQDAKKDGVVAMFARSWEEVKNAFAALEIPLRDGTTCPKS